MQLGYNWVSFETFQVQSSENIVFFEAVLYAGLGYVLD